MAYITLFLIQVLCMLQVQSYLDFGLQVDDDTGNLIQPDYMSRDRFQQLQLLRFKDMMDSKHDEMKPQEVKPKRKKRDVGSENEPFASVPIGYYKKDTLMIQELLDVTQDDSSMSPVEADMLKFGQYLDRHHEYKLRFLVNQAVPGSSDVGITVQALNTSADNPTWIEAVPRDGEQSFSDFISFTGVPGAVISDIAVGRNPKSSFTFLCVTVDYKVPYPRKVSQGVDQLDINDPVLIPEAAKSLLFRFNLDSHLKYSLIKMTTLGNTSASLLDTSEAKDCEFWVYDGRLMLGIAQTGNNQTHMPLQTSKIYFQTKYDVAAFTEMEFTEDEKLISYQAVKVLQFEINSRSCVVFINNWLGFNKSPLFCYNFEKEKYIMEQFDLKTFGGRDAAFLSIHDTYPIHSRFFLIVCNTQEDYNGMRTPVSPTIFTFFKGRFVPFQVLSEVTQCQHTSAISVQDQPVSDPAFPRFKTTNLRHLVTFLHQADQQQQLSMYQFDGVKFVRVLEQASLPVPDKYLETWQEGSGAAPNFNLITQRNGKFISLKPRFSGADSFLLSEQSRTNLKYCLEKKDRRNSEQNFNELYEEFRKAPVRDDTSTVIELESVTFADNATVELSNVHVEDGLSPLKLSVDGLQTILSDYPDRVNQIHEKVLNSSANLNNLKSIVEDANFAKVNVHNNFAGDLVLNNVTGNKLTGDTLELSDEFSVINSTSGMLFNTTDFFQNVVIISGPRAEENAVGYLLDEKVKIENIDISGEYQISKLNGIPVQNFVDASKSEVTIAGNLVLKARNNFTGNFEADKVNNHHVNTSTILLRSGDQKMKTLKFNSGLSAKGLNISQLNGVDLSITERALVIEDVIDLRTNLTVRGLNVVGEVDTHMYVQDVDDTFFEVDVDDLFDNHMSKTKDMKIRALHRFDAADGGVNAGDVNGFTWPDDFVNKDVGTLEHSGTLKFDNFNMDGQMIVTESITSAVTGNSLNVDSNGLLPLIELKESNDTIVITGNKTVDQITLNVDSLVLETLQGFNLTELKEEIDAGERIITDNFDLDMLKVDGKVNISVLDLLGSLQTSCGQDCKDNQLHFVYANGIKVNATEIANAHLTFESIHFLGDVSVKEINSVDPGNDFVTLDGTEPRVLNDITFMDQVSLAKNMTQVVTANLTACQPNRSGRTYCKPEFCHEVSSVNDLCEKVNKECLIKAGVKNQTLCESTLTNNLDYLHENSLKVHGETRLHRGIVFHGGVQAKKIEVRSNDCKLNGKFCDKIARTNVPEVYTEFNEFHGSVHVGNSLFINNLKVDGEIDSVNMSFVYEDTLFKDYTFPQFVEGLQFNDNFTVAKFHSNDVAIGMTTAESIRDRSDHVLNVDQIVHINGGFDFTEDVISLRFDANKFNGVNLTNLFKNKVTDANQEIGGDITVAGDVAFLAAVNKGSANALIDNLDLVELADKAVRIDGDRTINLNDVNLEHVFFEHPRGIRIGKEFLGVEYPNNVVTSNDRDKVLLHGNKKYLNEFIVNNITFTNSTWRGTTEDEEIPLNKLFEFIKKDSLENVKFHDHVTYAVEPTITNFNGFNLTELIMSIWMRNREDEINFPVSFDNITVTTKTILDHSKINDVNLTDIKQNYLSLSEDSSSPLILEFQNGARFFCEVSTPIVTLSDGAEEKAIVMQDHRLTIANLNEVALHKNDNTTLSMTLVFENITANEIKLADGILTNGVDLSADALIYSEDDKKVVDNAVTIIGDFNVGELEIEKAITFPSDLSHSQVHTGIALEDGKITLVPDDMIANAVLNTNDPSEVSGIKNFRGAVSIATLKAATVNNLDIGNCTNPNVVLKTLCSGEIPQNITGVWSLQNDVQIANLNVSVINGHVFDDVIKTLVLKSNASSLVLSGANTFEKGIALLGDATFHGTVFGLEEDQLRTEELPSLSVEYMAGGGLPNLTNLVEHVKKQSEELQPEYLYSSSIEWKDVTSSQGWIFSMLSMKDSNPLHFIGVEEFDGGRDVRVCLYSLPSQIDKNTRSDMSCLQSYVGNILSRDFLKITTIPVDSTSRVLVFTEVSIVLENQTPPERLDITTRSGSFNGYIAAYTITTGDSVDDIQVRLTQEAFSSSKVKDTDYISVRGRKCVILCMSELGATIQCLNDDLKLEKFKDLKIDCHRTSTTPGVNYLDQELPPYISMVHGVNGTDLKILKIGEDLTISELADISISAMSESAITSFIDSNGVESLFLVVLPQEPAEDLCIFKYNLDLAEFELFDTLFGVKAASAEFLQSEHDSIPMLSLNLVRICSADELCETSIETFYYREFMRFSGSPPSESLGLHSSVRQIAMAFNSQNQKFVSTRRHPGLVSDPVIRKYVYKENRAVQLREEFDEKANLAPEFITLNCHSMVSAYLKRLYHNSRYQVSTISQLFLSLMPRAHVTIRPKDIPADVNQVLQDPKFKQHVKPEPPVAVANMYRYTDLNTFERIIDDLTYLGSVLVYKGVDEVLYMYSRLLIDELTGEYFATSFWTDCNATGVQIPFDRFNGTEVDPRLTLDPDQLTGHQCSLVHDVDSNFCSKLTSLDNKADAGALVVHKGTSTQSERLGCGYLKKPVTAKIGFYRDHDEQDIKFDPFIVNSV